MADRFVSVVIPVAGSTGLLKECMEAVLRQRYAKKELILVAAPGRASQLPKTEGEVRVITAPGKQSFPRSVNAGLRAARGDIKVLLAPHCIPIGERWLEELIASFDDGTVGAVVSQQIAPREEKPRLPARLLHTVQPHELKNTTNEPISLQLVSHLADAYRNGVFRDLGYMDEDAFASPGESVDISIRMASAGRRIVLSPAAAVLCHEPPDADSLASALRKALDYGYSDAVLSKAHNIEWLGSNVYAAALLSLLLLPMGLLSLPGAFIAAGVLFAWGWFLPLRLPFIRWDWPLAILNLGVYIAMILSIRGDWAPGIFDRYKWHPAIIRQWCALSAMTISYLLVLLRVGVRSAVRSIVSDRSAFSAPAVLILSMPWWLLAGAGYLYGYALGRAKKPYSVS